MGKRRGLFFGASLIALLILSALAAPMVSQWLYYEQFLAHANQPPSFQYWFGTDSLGRDLFSRVFIGVRISLFLGVAASAFSVLIGTIYGSLAGYLGGYIEEVMMKVVEVFYSIPFILYIILLMLIFEPGMKSIIIAMALVCWLNTARAVRAEVKKVMKNDYVLAARAMGAHTGRILFLHIIPNVTYVLGAMFVITIPEVIFAEAILSFLGLGFSGPAASLGYLIQDGLQGIRSYPWQLIFPGSAMILIMLGFQFLADGIGTRTL